MLGSPWLDQDKDHDFEEPSAVMLPIAQSDPDLVLHMHSCRPARAMQHTLQHLVSLQTPGFRSLGGLLVDAEAAQLFPELHGLHAIPEGSVGTRGAQPRVCPPPPLHLLAGLCVSSPRGAVDTVLAVGAAGTRGGVSFGQML